MYTIKGKVFIMKIDFRPRNLVRNLALEEKLANGIRRIISTPKNRTIDMTLSNLDSIGNVYPKGYYISSFKSYNSKGMLVKSIERNVTGSANSETVIKKAKTDLNGNITGYNTSSIVRNNNTVTKTELNK